MVKIKKQPLVSVIVTTFNRKEYLSETLHSILMQTMTDFELLVIDNYSDYDFLNFMLDFSDKRIRAYQNKNHGIIATNRNFGILKARGEFIAFCDDDDIWMAHKLEKQIPYFKKNDIVGVGSTMLVNKGVSRQAVLHQGKSREVTFKELLNFSSVALSSLVVKNTGLLFDEAKTLHTVEDFHFQLKLTEQGGVIQIINEPLVNYRIHEGSESNDFRYELNIITLLSKFEKKIDYKYYKVLLSRAYLQIGYKCVRSGRSGGFTYAVKSISKNYSNKMAYLLLILSIIPRYFKNIFFRFYYPKT
jgi:teichuronic acid biosynthesis glycosyltransferase TuaG